MGFGMHLFIMPMMRTEVKFIVNGEEHAGILCRLAHCFGRGLLIYKADVKPEKGAVINVILPLTGNE
jgi:hypothetical protein